MTCKEIENQIALLFDGENLEMMSESVNQHLTECPACYEGCKKLCAINEVLTKNISIPVFKQVDTQVMEAFRRRFENQHRTKEAFSLVAMLNVLRLSPKMIATLVTFLFIASISTAFQFGRMTATGNHPITKQQEKLSQPNSKEQIASGSSSEKLSETKQVAPVAKIVKVPVIKEKIIVRTVYLEKPTKNTLPLDRDFVNNKEKPMFIKSSMQRNEFVTETNLKGFSRSENSKVEIIKKGETDEN